MLDAAFYAKADEIMSKYPAHERSLIPVIHDVQETYNYVPLELLPYIAKHIGITETKAYSVASFYERFSFEPKGKYIIRVCDGTACHVRQSLPVLERLRSELGLSPQKHTTDDMLFTVETVSCLGACSLAPALMVNDHVHPAMTPDKADQLIAALREEAAKS